jgi:hypothetical protein
MTVAAMMTAARKFWRACRGGGDAPPTLETADGAFDDVARSIDAPLERVLVLTCRIVGNHGRGAKGVPDYRHFIVAGNNRIEVW